MTCRLEEKRSGPSVSEPDGGVGVGDSHLNVRRAIASRKSHPMNWVTAREYESIASWVCCAGHYARRDEGTTGWVLALNENGVVRYDEQCTSLLV